MLVKCTWLVLCFVSVCDCANILAIVPCASYSHQIAYTHLWKELSLRGHKVTVLTTDPLNDPKLTNLTEIDVKWSYKYAGGISQWAENSISTWTFHMGMLDFMSKISRDQLELPVVQDLIHKPKSFDVVFVEFLTPEWLALGEIYNCPTILFASMEVTASYYHLIGNPAHPILHPEFVGPFHGQLSFQERVMSTVLSLYWKIYFTFVVFPTREKILHKYFDTNSTVTGLINNLDMMFLSVSPHIQGPRALGPNTISIAGYREDVSPDPLPSDVKTFLDDAKEGCVYVSFGSNVKSSQLRQSLQKSIFDALSELPYKVLWKFEADSLDVPNHIKAAKWLPQQKVLNHPNVKLLLGQGGLQTMEEAIYGEVPSIVIPFFSDQFQNARILKNKGIAIVLDHYKVTKDEIKDAVITMMIEPKYREGVKKLKQLILDEPMTGLEKAVWWTEYVIRNKGAKQLRNPAADLPLYQYFLLDVIIFLLVVTFVTISVVLLALKKFCKLIFYFRQKKQKTQ